MMHPWYALFGAAALLALVVTIAVLAWRDEQEWQADHAAWLAEQARSPVVTR